MKTESQKLALLEWAGWTKITRTADHRQQLIGVDSTRMKVVHRGEYLDQYEPVPNLDSLDCLAEFEAKLSPANRIAYVNHLFNQFDEGQGWDNSSTRLVFFPFVCATPKHRLEALVRALGLWREGE